MRYKKPLLFLAGFLFLVPVIALLHAISRLVTAYGSLGRLSEAERPDALSRAVEEFQAYPDYGVVAYLLGLALLFLLARRGDKSESRLLWYVAIGTAASLLVKGTFLLGILVLVLLIWKRRFLKESPGRIALVALGFFLLLPSAAEACSCMPQGNIRERKAISDLVFDGRLASEAVDTAQGSRRMRFTVRKAWKKGKREWVKHVRIETPLESASCGFGMQVGERALIFATESRENGRRVYRTHLCSENIVAPSRRQADSLGMKPLKPQPPKEDS